MGEENIQYSEVSDLVNVEDGEVPEVGWYSGQVQAVNWAMVMLTITW